jgi:hypothetical protein
MKIKIITSFNLDILENKVNDWFAENPNIQILQFEFKDLTVLIRYRNEY